MVKLKTEVVRHGGNTCAGCYFNKGEEDFTCYKFYDLDKEYEDVECFDDVRYEHLIFIED